MKASDFNKLMLSVRQAGKIKRGKMKSTRITEFKPADVRAIRRRLAKSQTEFAYMIGVSVATLQNWEQGRRKPEGAARILLRVAAKHPESVLDVVSNVKLRKRA